MIGRGIARVLFLLAATSPALPAAEAWQFPGPSREPTGERKRGAVVRFVPFTAVTLARGWLGERLARNREVTIPFALDECERTGRIANFARAGGLEEGPFRGRRYDDSDVFKVVEGTAASLASHRDAQLAARVEDIVRKIAAAQEDDGYLYTIRTLGAARDRGRWSELGGSHELYNLGHLFQAAVAHARATGQRTLVDVALRAASAVDHAFGPGRLELPPGHQEIELGLIDLSRWSGDARWLDLARFFLDSRGRTEKRPSYGAYSQDHLPVREQREAVGHAVRALYMYAAMAAVQAANPAAGYSTALDSLWRDVVGRKLYVTGGVGAERSHEGFGPAYELPNAGAYAETCAAIALCSWCRNTFELTGEAAALDVLERTLYNAVLAGVSLEGDSFFYPCPLEVDGVTPFNHGSCARKPWFECSCCPANIARFLPQVGGLLYGVAPGTVAVHLYAESRATIPMEDVAPGAASAGDGSVVIRQRTDYPWSGTVRVEIEPRACAEFTLRLRIPGWARGRPVPSTLYRTVGEVPAEPAAAGISITRNGDPVPLVLERGFALLPGPWRSGDVVELDLPLRVRRMRADARVAADRGRVALERGPLVYCFEAIDCGGAPTDSLILPPEVPVEVVDRPDLLGGVVVLRAPGARVVHGDDTPQGDDTPRVVPCALTAVPFYVWGNRGPGAMSVWIATDFAAARTPPPETIASRARVRASHCWFSDTPEAVHDRRLPASSGDHSIPRHTWWDHRGTVEWLEYRFASPQTLRRSAVYFFDDSGRGECRLPESWRLLVDTGDGELSPLAARAEYPVRVDRYCAVDFEPVTCTRVRLEVQLRPGCSGGVLEWTVDE